MAHPWAALARIPETTHIATCACAVFDSMAADTTKAEPIGVTARRYGIALAATRLKVHQIGSKTSTVRQAKPRQLPIGARYGRTLKYGDT